MKRSPFVTAIREVPHRTPKHLLLPASRATQLLGDPVKIIAGDYALEIQVTAKRFKLIRRHQLETELVFTVAVELQYMYGNFRHQFDDECAVKITFRLHDSTVFVCTISFGKTAQLDKLKPSFFPKFCSGKTSQVSTFGFQS